MPRHMAGLCFLPSTPFRQTKESEDSVHARDGRGMENWKLIGWVLLVGGALFGVVFGWLQVGDGLWLGLCLANSYFLCKLRRFIDL